MVQAFRWSPGHWSQQTKPPDALKGGGKQPPRNGRLRHLEGQVPGMLDHLGPDLDQLLPQRRQRPVLDKTGKGGEITGEVTWPGLAGRRVDLGNLGSGESTETTVRGES